MNVCSQWEVIRHQVAICGRVVDDHDNALANIEISLTSMPEVFSNRISALADNAKNQATKNDGPDRAVTRENGSFYFLDLPGGKYTLNALDAKTGSMGHKEVEVTWDKKGDVNKITVNLKISMKPT
jgi:hypothetical protein